MTQEEYDLLLWDVSFKMQNIADDAFEEFETKMSEEQKEFFAEDIRDRIYK